MLTVGIFVNMRWWR